jgi:uncharacterized membrane protein YfcA
MVDAARVPVYLWLQHGALEGIGTWIAIASVGVIAGTIIGMRVLRWIPEATFRRTVAVLLGLLGAGMIMGGANR